MIMATKSIAWPSGTGSITIEYDGSGNGTIQVSSDPNNLYENRSTQIVVQTTDGSNISRTVTIAQAAKVRIDISNATVSASNQTYSGTAKTPTPTVTLNGETIPSSGYDVAYSDNTNAGTATITVTGKGDYTGTASGTFNIAKASPLYTAPTYTSPTYSGLAQNLLNAGSTSNGTIQYSSNGSDWSTTIPQGTNAATYTSYWRLVGDSNHNDVSSTSIVTTIGKVTPTVTIPTAKVLTYNTSAQALVNAGSTDFGTLKYSLDNSTWSTSIPTATNQGSYTVYYKVEGDSNVNSVSSSSVACSINEKQVTATVILSESSYTYDGNAKQPTVTVKDGSTIIPSSEYSVSYSNNTNAGTATVTITDNVGGNYNVIGSATFTINKASGSVNISGVSSSYSESSQPLVSVSGATGTMHYSTDYSNWSTSIPESTNTGSWTIYWYMDASTNYEGIGVSSERYVSSSIAKIDPTITAYPTNANQTYNGSDQYLLTGGTANVSGTFSYSTGKNAGSYTATWSFTPSDTRNYNTISGTVSATIAKASQSAPTATGASVSYGNTATATVSGGGGQGSIEWSNGDTLSGNAGSKTTKARWSGNSNYEASAWSNEVTLAITKINPTITAPTAKSGLTYTGSSQTLYNAGSNTTPGSFSYTDGTRTNAGSQTVSWSFTPTDTTNYNSMSGSFSVTIAKANRTLSFAISYAVLDTSSNATYSATPSAGSGDGAITYSISSTTYATINSSSGKVTSKTSDGSATVTATIAEGTNYLSASDSYTLYVFATTHDFSYTGSVQSLDLLPGSYKLQCWGAQGGSNAAASTYGITAKAGGKGGYSEGVLTVSQDRTVYVFVGGQGSSSGNGGWNGGGGCLYGRSSFNLKNYISGYFTTSGSITGDSSWAVTRYYIPCSPGDSIKWVYDANNTTDVNGSHCLIFYNSSGDMVDFWNAFGGQYGNGYRNITADSNTYYIRASFVKDAGAEIYINNSLVWSQGTVYGTSRFGGGGGGTDIALTTSSMSYSDYRTNRSSASLLSRIIVAGGGSGGSMCYDEVDSQNNYQVGWPGGGATAGGYSSTYRGKQDTAGADGGFGYGATQDAENWRFVSGAGGGGWYGGGRARDDEDIDTVEKSGGGSGFVNTAGSASYRPSGYTGLQLDSGSTTAGSSSFVAPSGGNETGHAGNGYARITRL